MDFNEDALHSRSNTFRRSDRNETETSLEGSFGYGYVNTAFNSDGDDVDSPKTPTWSCNDTPRIPRWSTNDSLKDAMASIDELTSRLNSEDNISRVSSLSRSRMSPQSSEPQTPRSDVYQASNSTDTGVMARYENIAIDSPSQNSGVFTEESEDGNNNADDNHDRDVSEAERIKEIIESNLNHDDDDDYETYADTRPVIRGEIVTDESTAF